MLWFIYHQWLCRRDKRNILLYTNGINGIFLSVACKMLSLLRQSNHRDRFFKIFPHIPLKKKRSRRNFVHGLRSLSLTRQPTFSHISLLVVGKYDEFQKRWLWNLPQRESQKCYDHSCKSNVKIISLAISNIFKGIVIIIFLKVELFMDLVDIILLFWKKPLWLSWDCDTFDVGKGIQHMIHYTVCANTAM